MYAVKFAAIITQGPIDIQDSIPICFVFHVPIITVFEMWRSVQLREILIRAH